MYKLFDEEKESLVAYYLLPLLKISYRKFGAYFLDAKLTRDLSGIVVILAHGCKDPYWEHENYQNDYDTNLHTIVLFSIPDEFKSDVELFSNGKYSKISDLAKGLIYKHSGLYYNKQIDNKIVTDKVLLALTKNKVLEEWILREYGIKKGKNSEFIKLENKEIIYFNGNI